MSALIRYKGFGDLLVASILTFRPSLIYHSSPARYLAALSGLHLSNAEQAPGFNQALACMVAAVGVGHLVAACSGRAARPSIFAMNLTWGILCLATCVTPKAWGLGSATLLMSGINHITFSVAMYFTDPSFTSIKSDTMRKTD